MAGSYEIDGYMPSYHSDGSLPQDDRAYVLDLERKLLPQAFAFFVIFICFLILIGVLYVVLSVVPEPVFAAYIRIVSPVLVSVL